jgi:bifunctional ADP-heptose synthase (sugar kinase/adenylyltransferase)
VDTRSKILTLAEAQSLRLPKLVVVTGYFDLLRAGHAQELAAIRRQTAAGTLLAVVLPWEAAYMEQRARAEMAAALRVVDYVVAPDTAEASGDLAALAASLGPSEVVRMEAADACRNRELIEHVHRRHSV